jgi:hypothetical protein
MKAFTNWKFLSALGAIGNFPQVAGGADFIDLNLPENRPIQICTFDANGVPNNAVGDCYNDSCPTNHYLIPVFATQDTITCCCQPK